MNITDSPIITDYQLDIWELAIAFGIFRSSPEVVAALIAEVRELRANLASEQEAAYNLHQELTDTKSLMHSYKKRVEAQSKFIQDIKAYRNLINGANGRGFKTEELPQLLALGQMVLDIGLWKIKCNHCHHFTGVHLKKRMEEIRELFKDS